MRAESRVIPTMKTRLVLLNSSYRRLFMVIQSAPICFSAPFRDFKYLNCEWYIVEQGGCAAVQPSLCPYFFGRDLPTVASYLWFYLGRLSQPMQEEKREGK